MRLRARARAAQRPPKSLLTPGTRLDQNLVLLVVLDNSSQTNLEANSIPVFFAHLLQHLKVLYREVGH